MERKFEPISQDAREVNVMAVCMRINDFRKELVAENTYKYELELQGCKFITYLSEEEINKSINYALDLMEELKEINNNGFGELQFKELVTEMENKTDSQVGMFLTIFNEFSSERLREIIAEISEFRQVGGAFATLIEQPVLISGIVAVFEKMVANFEDKELYTFAVYFLTRAILKMSSEDMEEKIDEKK